MPNKKSSARNAISNMVLFLKPTKNNQQILHSFAINNSIYILYSTAFFSQMNGVST